jgi:cold shock CspA family protein
MRYGTVVQYHPARGFGFIRPYFGPDVFFHITALGACMPEPRIEPGQPVKYELIPDTELKRRRPIEPAKSDEPERPQAKFVELIDKLPGKDLEKKSEKLQSSRHPRARKKKPTWRR